MPLKESKPDEEVVDGEVECDGQHVEDLDEGSRRFLSMFATIRSKVDDVERADSEMLKFENSIEAERKRLRKQLEISRLALRNARIQMGVELAKVDELGFSQIAAMLKDSNAS